VSSGKINEGEFATPYRFTMHVQSFELTHTCLYLPTTPQLRPSKTGGQKGRGAPEAARAREGETEAGQRQEGLSALSRTTSSHAPYLSQHFAL
jgi:hypothetical protein